MTAREVVERIYGPPDPRVGGGPWEVAQGAIRKLLRDEKAAGCVICGEDRLPCLDFHHVDPEDKLFSLSAARGYSLEQVGAELEKCVVLCSNCHRCLHADLVELPKPVQNGERHHSGHLYGA